MSKEAIYTDLIEREIAQQGESKSVGDAQAAVKKLLIDLDAGIEYDDLYSAATAVRNRIDENQPKSTLTVMEQMVYDAVLNNTNEEDMECVDIEDLVNITGIHQKKLRGVIASLVKKNKVEVEEYDANFRIQYFYWPTKEG